jgi:pyruvate/2-oxoacid:ferredoxin oxidoreductase alpha subunit
MRKFITGNTAVAEAVRLCRPDIIAAYPITPQTPIYEKLSDWEDSGKIKGKMMRMESEHSAMAACLAASLTGVRTFTATSSQGLALMHEMLHFASGLRTGVVMAAVNRTLAAPWAFWSDQTDTLSQRDTGWMQVYCEDNQETADMIIQAFKIAETVLLPMMVILEANFISHFMEPVNIPSQKEVDAFLPAVALPRRFDLENPGYVSPTVTQKQFEAYRRRTSDAMTHALAVIADVDEAFGKAFGRSYGILETTGAEDAELMLVTTATITSTARVAVKELREEGFKVGLCKLRLFRPFPVQAVKEALKNVPKIAVLERNISQGREGVFCSELKSALINCTSPPQVQGYLAGIGGTNVDPPLIKKVVHHALALKTFSDGPVWMGGDA